MSILDSIIAFIVLVDLWRGFNAGGVKTAMSLVSWLIALVVSTQLADQVAVVIAPFLSLNNSVLQLAVAFLLTFLVVIAVLHGVVYVFAKTLKVLKLSFLDKLAGGMLGAAKGVLKVLVVLSIVAPLLVKLPMWQSSPLAQSLVPFAPVAKQMVLKAFDTTWQQINLPDDGNP